ncbi:MAG: glycyl-radical enzyme activating protein [Clostridia bacterium]|nr:glycyl-radical enzyme activating protein [Clostridia bacterium]
MKQGVIFDIKEMALYDGPGIRTTVFLKGCPLRCQWCHNPEGLSAEPELMVSTASCDACRSCALHCPTPEHCTACGACIPHCPQQLRRIVGQKISAEELAARLNKSASLIDGVTFSGGEPLMHWPFVQQVIRRLCGVHTAMETSGYAPDAVFQSAMREVSLIMMDVKQTDPALHRRYTGVDNEGILRHLGMLCRGETPFVIRLPVIPGVNDDDAHFQRVAELLWGAPMLQRVELLPYHTTAAAKYPMVARAYQPDFDPNEAPRTNTRIFEQAGIPAVVL